MQVCRFQSGCHNDHPTSPVGYTLLFFVSSFLGPNGRGRKERFPHSPPLQTVLSTSIYPVQNCAVGSCIQDPSSILDKHDTMHAYIAKLCKTPDQTRRLFPSGHRTYCDQRMLSKGGIDCRHTDHRADKIDAFLTIYIPVSNASFAFMFGSACSLSKSLPLVQK